MSKNHKPHDERELQQADATAYALGELSPAEAAQFERSKAMSGESSSDAAAEMEQARRLGQLLRSDIAGDVVGVGSTSGESIRCSTQVRESVLAALDAQETALPPKLGPLESPVVRRSRTRIWAWGLVASVAVAIGVFLLSPVQQVREAARRTEKIKTVDLRGGITFDGQPTDRIEPNGVNETQLPSDSPQLADQVEGSSDGLSKFRGMIVELSREEMKGEAADLGATSLSTLQIERAESHSADLKVQLETPPQQFAHNDSPNIDKGFVQGGMPLPTGPIRSRGEAKPSEKDPSDEMDMFFAQPESADARFMETQRERTVDQFGTGDDDMAGVPLAEGSGKRGESLLRALPNESGLTARAATAEASEGGGGGGLGGVFGFSSDLEGMDVGGRGGRGSTRRNPANEQYKSVPENPFWRPIGERGMSTFSIDVDTASYANVRRFLNEGSLPPSDAVRLEEFINYFHYDYPQPEEGSPFAVDLKLFGCPWNAQHSLLRVGLHGREIEAEKRPISNIVYLVDVSGSMSDDNKLPLLKRGLAMMVDHLSENDTVSIVTYAGEAGVRLEPTNGANKKRILDAIDSLQSGGSTNGAAGIEIAYRLAQQKFVSEGANRVILMTDGDLNVGVTSDEALVTLIKEKAATGVFLTVLGFGTGNLKDAKLEGLADNGNGIYGYIDSLGEAHKVLVEQMSGNLVTIAKDVKIQVEFNPAQVAGYRLIGYENRVMANQDFTNPLKDAGEIGAGHTVTALYEIVPVGAMLGVIDPSSPTLKYQTLEPAPRSENAQPKTEAQLTEAAASGELATVALRFKTPEGTESPQIEFTAKAEVTSFSQADSDCRFAAAVAGFGMRLRQSPYAGNITLDAIAEIASAAIGNDSSGHRAEFVDLVRRAKALQVGAGE